MDTDAITRQARAAVTALTAQLQALENQQSALLSSLSITHSTLSTLPNYTSIAPTLLQIPAYEAKLAHLKSAMLQQSIEVANLKRRAEEARTRKGRNIERIRRLREKEREADRTFLRAKMATGGGTSPSPRAAGTPRGSSPALGPTKMQGGHGPHIQSENDGMEDITQTGPARTPTPRTSFPALPPSPSPAPIKTVRRKKKPRQAEIH